MAILILAPKTDIHAIQIAWGLGKAGHQVVLWEGLGWQHERRVLIATGSQGGVWLGGRKLGPGDTVWLRRPSLAFGHPNLDPADEKFSKSEYSAFNATLLAHIEYTGAFCINKWSAATLIENKSLQLALAEQCGLAVLPTVMTNSYEYIDDFLRVITGEAVHKSFTPHLWIDRASRRVYACETSSLKSSCKYPTEIFTYAPAIYQQKARKQYDARITMIGGEFHAFIIEAEEALDWRLHIASGKGSIQHIELPPSVETGLRTFADRAGIVFGCFDMSVDRDGEWWFLEVNQSGQFLWVDDLCPEHGLYVPMLRFLCAREPLQPSHNHAFPTYKQCQAEYKIDPQSQPMASFPFITVEGEVPEPVR